MKARRLCAFVLLVMALAAPMAPVTVRAGDGMRPSRTETKESIQATVSGQLAAFRSDDYQAAYVFSGQEFKAQMPVDRFERMVKLAYPVIAHSVSVRFGLTFDNGEEATVNAEVVGGSETITYQYHLRREGGAWRINGVTLLREQTVEV